MANRSHETKLARHVQKTMETDTAFEIPSYTVCLNLVRRHAPALIVEFDGQEKFGDKLRAALVEKVRENLRRVGTAGAHSTSSARSGPASAPSRR